MGKDEKHLSYSKQEKESLIISLTKTPQEKIS